MTMPVTIAKFASLTNTRVAEQIETTWDRWLDFLVAEPADSFAGQMEHGGWSPAIFDPPRRLKDNVRRIQALVLDHDSNANWDTIHTLWAQSYGAIHTTKSHRETDHRVRVVLPLSRSVSAEEYARIWAWAAARSVICPVDPQTKDTCRFWYDPSAPSDGAWRGERLTGEPIDPDAILALVVESPKLKVVPPPADRAVDAVERASRYLSKLPPAISGQLGHLSLWNAVAHVMVGFDLTDAEARRLIVQEYNQRCEPPWSEKEIDHKITDVSERCNRERGYLLNARRPDPVPMASAVRGAPDDDVDWVQQLLVKKDRSPRKDYHNVLVFVRHHPDYRGRWSIDTRVETPHFNGSPLRPSLVHDIRAHAGARLGYTPSPADVEAAIVKSCEDRPFNPILRYLRSVDWDGVPRLSAMARDYLGSPSELHAEMLKRWMIGAAARVIWPGCKLDTALMLQGKQGLYKSTFFSILGGEWHSDSFIDISNKDSYLQLNAAWIYELSELENVVSGRAESRLKAWMSSSYDTYRPPYQRAAVRRYRSVIICGTTNREEFLTDNSGSRRFWIVPVTRPINRDLLVELRDQLWAEAVCAAESGERWWLADQADFERSTANREFDVSDSWVPAITEWLSRPDRKRTTVGEVLEQVVQLELAKHDRSAQMRVAAVLKRAGWVRRQEATGSRSRYYARPDSHPDEHTSEFTDLDYEY